MPVDIEQQVLPGPELEPLPVTDKTPVVIRIDAVYPLAEAARALAHVAERRAIGKVLVVT